MIQVYTRLYVSLHNNMSCLNLSSDLVVSCLDQFFGYDTSSCAHPCQTFQARTKYLSGVKTLSPDYMGVKMKFSPKVGSDSLDFFQYDTNLCFFVMQILEGLRKCDFHLI